MLCAAHGLRRFAALLAWFACLPPAAGLAKLSDKDALVSLYEAAGGASWSLSADAPNDAMLQPGGNTNWDLSADPCPIAHNESWHGVSCMDPCYYPIDGEDCRFGRVTGLSLQFNNLEGTIPDVVFNNLINLTIIDLSHNSLSGTIPTTVGKLRNVMSFQLNHNRLSGTIPTEIRTMGSHMAPDEMAISLEDYVIPPEDGSSDNATEYDLERAKTMGMSNLDLSHNNLNGTLPTTIGELVNLQAIDVSDNPELGADGCCEGADSYYLSFYGYNTTVPTEIGSLTRLQMFNMDYSRFMRQIPTEVGNLHELQFWRLRGTFETNQVSGTIPTQFGRLTKLSEFLMDNNTLSGSLPEELSNMASLETFAVQDNHLSGSLPQNMGDMGSLYLWDTYGNKLEGDLPDSVERLGNIEYFYIQNEHTGVLRNYFCKQRIASSAVGRKYNWQMIVGEFRNYRYVSACANPYDVETAFGALSGDV